MGVGVGEWGWMDRGGRGGGMASCSVAVVAGGSIWRGGGLLAEDWGLEEEVEGEGAMVPEQIGQHYTCCVEVK